MQLRLHAVSLRYRFIRSLLLSLCSTGLPSTHVASMVVDKRFMPVLLVSVLFVQLFSWGRMFLRMGGDLGKGL